MNWNSKLIRRSLAAIILFAAIIVIVPSLFVEQSFNSIINGRIVSIHSPVEGTVSDFVLEIGEPLKTKEKIATINNIRLNASFRKELEVERNTLVERTNGFDRHLTELKNLRSSLQERLKNTKSFESIKIDKQIKEQEFELAALKDNLNDLEKLFRVQSQLIKSGSISEREYESTKNSILMGTNRYRALEQKIDILKTEKSALSNGVFLGEGRNDVPYTQQKLDEINVIISDYNSRKMETVQRIKELDSQINSEDGRLSLSKRVDLTSPVNGIIWKKPFPDGSEVVIGQEIVQIVDCDRLFLEVEVNENSLEQIEMGSFVKYRLRNSDDWILAKITGKSGSGRTKGDSSLAAELHLERTQAKIIVAISKDKLDRDPRNYCHIGRKVEVTLPRTWTTGAWLTRIQTVLRWN